MVKSTSKRAETGERSHKKFYKTLSEQGNLLKTQRKLPLENP